MHTECRPQMCRFTLQYSFAVVFTLMFITSTLSSIETAKSENTAIKHNDMNDQGMFFIDDPPVSDGTIEGSGYPDEGDDEDEDKDEDPGENGSGDTPFNEDDDFSASGDGEISPEPTDLSHSSTLASSTSTTTSTTTTTTTSTTTTPLSTTVSDKPTKKESTKKPIFSIDEEVKFRKNSKDAKESDINNNKITDHNFVPESAETSTKNTISTTPKSKEPSHPVDSNNQGIDVSILGRKQEAKPFSFLTQPGILAAVIGGAVVGLLCAILLVMFIVYRMRKKDEGSYALDEPKMSPAANPYAKGNSREFYA